MLGESKAKRINYAHVVLQSAFWLNVFKVAKTSFLAFTLTLVPYFYLIKYTYTGNASEYFITIGYALWMKFYGLALFIMTPILKIVHVTNPSSNSDSTPSIYDEILFEHKNYFVLTLTCYVCLSILLSYLFVLWLNKKGKQLNEGQRIREDEVSVIDEKVLIKLIQQRVNNIKNNTEFTTWDLYFSKNLRVPFMDWFTHFMISGSSRSGKSNFIKSQLSIARLSKMKGCIVDIDGDYLETFYKPGDHILSLNDVRSLPWDFWHEPSIPPSFFSNALLSPEKDSTEFFDTAGGKLLTCIIRLSENHEHFWKILCLDGDSLLKLFEDSNDPIVSKYIGRAGSDQGIGAVASSIKNLDFVKYLNHHPRTESKNNGKALNWFSFNEWAKKKDDTFVFIVAKDNEWEESKPLIKVQVETFVSAMFERGESKNNIPTVLVMDELHKIGKLQVIEQLLSRGSKYFLTAFVGYQNNAQVESIYGEKEAKSIFSGLQNLVAFKCTDPDLANQISERLGKIEVETSEGSMGSSNSNSNVSIRTKEKSNVSANQIMSLEKNCAWVKLAYYPPCYLEFDYVEYGKAKYEDGRPVEKTVSIRPKNSWIEEIKPYDYYFGKNELKKLVTSYHNYMHYFDIEKVAAISEIFREIAFKVQNHECELDGAKYSFEANEENILIVKEEDDKVLFSHIIKRSKKKIEKEEKEAKEKTGELGGTKEEKKNKDKKIDDIPHQEVPTNETIENYFL